MTPGRGAITLFAADHGVAAAASAPIRSGTVEDAAQYRRRRAAICVLARALAMN